MPRPIAVDLFAGAGGMSLGFEQAGFDIRAAVEVDPVHCAAHKFNFPKCTVIARSVTDRLTGREIRKAARLKNKKIACVFGGPPCQGFSLIGQRSLEDPRNALVRHFVRLVSELDAQTFVFENVKGLTLGIQKAFLDEVVALFEKRGYQVLPWQVLDAARFGVPQHRERLILIGVKKRLLKGKKVRLPKYPNEITAPADEKVNPLGLQIGPTCLDALGDLPDVDRYPDLVTSDKARVASYRYGKRSPYAVEMRCGGKKSWHYGYRRKWESSYLTSSWRADHTESSQRRFKKTAPNSMEPVSRFYRLAPKGLSNTLRAGTDAARGAFTSPRPIHYKYARCITVREMARLHGFPDWFRFNATKWHGARQVGNAVPPPLARVIAAEMMKSLNKKPNRPKKPMALGSEDLLYMGVSSAASHFNVDAPAGRRAHKSGAKKRKQAKPLRLAS